MFLKNVGIAAEQVAILYLMAVIGAICEKTGIFTESTAKKCTDLLFYVVTTAKILESFISLEYSKQTARNLFIAIGCGLAMHAVASLGVAPLFNRSEPKKASVYKFAAMFGNCGYMGLPLVDAVVGREGVFYCSAVIISFQIFNFTYGVRLMTIGEGDGKSKIDFKKLILNPGVLPVFAGLPVFLLSLKLPGLITVPITSLASMNSPLAMLIFGTFIANTDFKSVIKQWRMLCVALFKLVLMPACMMAAVKLIGLTGPLALTLIVASATPPANNTIMFSAKYDRDTGLASQMVAVISFLSILTLPVVIALSKVWIV